MHIRRETGGLSGRRRPPTINTNLPPSPSSGSHYLLSDNPSSALSQDSNSSTGTYYYFRPTIERPRGSSPLYILRLLRRPTSTSTSTSSSSSSTSSHFSLRSSGAYYHRRTRNPSPHHEPVSLTPMERFLREDRPRSSVSIYPSGGNFRTPTEASSSTSNEGPTERELHRWPRRP
jgi:hypothetical protein